MFNYDGQTCEVCKETFDKSSDIVVCPECGTPHHRRCWNQLGHCINEAKHAQGFEWLPKAPKNVSGSGSVTCPNCQSVMPRGTLFCENCGSALSSNPASNQGVGQNNGNFNNQQPPFFAPMGQSELNAQLERELAGEIDGVRIKDIAVYIGPSSQYYIYKFKRMNQQPGYKPFCWSAFLFPDLYFMYRKMWGIAIGFLMVFAIIGLPSTILTLASMGAIPSSSPLLFNNIETVSYICSLILMMVRIIAGFIAVPMYKKATIKKVKEIRSAYEGRAEEYYRTLMRQSGPSKVATVLIVFMITFYTLGMLFS